MTAIRFTRAVGAGSVSAIALCLALGAPVALAQETLPTIEVGRKTTAPSSATPQPTAQKPKPAPVVAEQQPQPAPANAPLTQPKAPDEASSVKVYTGQQVTDRIYAQPQEALEIVPGLVIAQHSGSGKAAQYFLRGFALDHGYDIGITLDGMNINQPSHVHSNGYADTNFLIPELLSVMDVRKGPYFADEGVFSSVGAVHMQYVDQLREGLVSASGGSFAWGRLLGAKSWGVGTGELLMAIEGNIYNGPWERPDEERKINGVARWSTGTEENGFSVTGMAYSNHYFATDQIPYHLVAMGLMSRWGTQDPTDGGNAARYSLSARWSETNKSDWSRVEAYFIHNDTNLYDDFTYQLANPYPGPGDQSHQFDHRNQFGLNAEHGWKYNLATIPTETRVGMQNLFDFIHNGNGESFQRSDYDQISNNYIKEYIQAAWTDTTLRWTPWLRTTGGFRLDYVHGSVNSLMNPVLAQGWPAGQPAYLGSFNNGELGRFFTSPKSGLVLGPFYNTELFLNYGEGLRAEDMRAATNHYSTNGVNVNYIPNVQLLTKTRGAEAGFRSKLIEGLDTSLTFFWQNLDAEQEFNADSATSVYGRPGRRYGFEWTGNYSPNSWLHFDGEVTGTHARFKGFDTIQAVAFANYLAGGFGDPLFPLAFNGSQPGNYLSLAPVWVATGGVEIGEKKGWFGGLQYRYFGARPLTEDGQIQSPATGTVNARVGYRFDNGWKVQLDGFNILNSRSDMIDYSANIFGKQDFVLFPGYAGASAGILERTFKPIDPPAFRITLSGPLSFGESAPIVAKY
jgi:outer membrane receptor protein involved in Fe transport